MYNPCYTCTTFDASFLHVSGYRADQAQNENPKRLTASSAG